MSKCAWCEYAEVPKEENVHDDDEIGSVDSEGDWICDECRDEAIFEAINAREVRNEKITGTN